MSSASAPWGLHPDPALINTVRLSYLTSPAPAPDFRVKYGNNVFLCHKVLFLHPLQDSEVFRRLISDDPTRNEYSLGWLDCRPCVVEASLRCLLNNCSIPDNEWIRYATTGDDWGAAFIEFCIVFARLKAPNLIRSMEHEIKTLCNNMINNLARVQKVRRSDGSWVYDWDPSCDDQIDVVRAEFRGAISLLYTHPPGHESLLEVKRILFRFLDIAGGRFISTQEILTFSNEVGMRGFQADALAGFVTGSLPFVSPDEVRYSIKDRRINLRQAPLTSSVCCGVGCGRNIFQAGLTLTADLRETEQNYPDIEPSLYCEECADSGNLPDWIAQG